MRVRKLGEIKWKTSGEGVHLGHQVVDVMIILKWIRVWTWFKGLRIGCCSDDFVNVGINC